MIFHKSLHDIHIYPIARPCDKRLPEVNCKTDRKKEIEPEPKCADDIKSK